MISRSIDRTPCDETRKQFPNGLETNLEEARE